MFWSVHIKNIFNVCEIHGLKALGWNSVVVTIMNCLVSKNVTTFVIDCLTTTNFVFLYVKWMYKIQTKPKINVWEEKFVVNSGRWFVIVLLFKHLYTVLSIQSILWSYVQIWNNQTNFTKTHLNKTYIRQKKTIFIKHKCIKHNHVLLFTIQFIVFLSKLCKILLSIFWKMMTIYDKQTLFMLLI